VAVYRIDKERRWDSDRLELLPVERRKVYVLPEYECQVLLPADSVALIDLIDR
jgi:hypothetical protein